MLKNPPQILFQNKIAYHLWQPAQQVKTGHPTQAIYFSHATGVPVHAYKELLATLANQLNIIVVAVDLQGFGESADPSLRFPVSTDLWTSLGNSHAESWTTAKMMVKEQLHLDAELTWTFVGHSIGAWFSIWAALKTRQVRAIALDLVWLPPKRAFFWALITLLGLRAHHPVGMKTLKRRTQFSTFQDAFSQFQNQRFFQGWTAPALHLYIEALFKESPAGIVLNHLPSQEAALFFGQPRSMTKLFKKFSETERSRLQVVFAAGDASQTCDSKGFSRFHAVFPASRKLIVPAAGHMFPLSDPQATFNLIKGILQPDSPN